jgi:hypothetical protein
VVLAAGAAFGSDCGNEAAGLVPLITSQQAKDTMTICRFIGPLEFSSPLQAVPPRLRLHFEFQQLASLQNFKIALVLTLMTAAVDFRFKFCFAWRRFALTQGKGDTSLARHPGRPAPHQRSIVHQPRIGNTPTRSLILA